MKDQYVGDIGDFGKLLLLKHLAGLGFKIGVNWVLTKNDERGDGKHRDYVDYRGRDCLCCCDRRLLENIAPLARTQRVDRKIGDLENLIRGFSVHTDFYKGYFDGDEVRSGCDENAFNKLKPDAANLVFFDPDNGIGGEQGQSAKHVYLADLRRYWKRGQSLLIYHHLPQHNFAVNAIRHLKEQLQSLSNVHLKCYHFRRERQESICYAYSQSILCVSPKPHRLGHSFLCSSLKANGRNSAEDFRSPVQKIILGT